MGDIVSMRKERSRAKSDKRHARVQDYVRGQQVLADAIFHWRNDPGDDARAAVRLLMHHLATQFRADDSPLQPRPVEGEDRQSPPLSPD